MHQYNRTVSTGQSKSLSKVHTTATCCCASVSFQYTCYVARFAPQSVTTQFHCSLFHYQTPTEQYNECSAKLVYAVSSTQPCCASSKNKLFPPSASLVSSKFISQQSHSSRPRRLSLLVNKKQVRGCRLSYKYLHLGLPSSLLLRTLCDLVVNVVL